MNDAADTAVRTFQREHNADGTGTAFRGEPDVQHLALTIFDPLSSRIILWLSVPHANLCNDGQMTVK
jgi:hypothetical protein